MLRRIVTLSGNRRFRAQPSKTSPPPARLARARWLNPASRRGRSGPAAKVAGLPPTQSSRTGNTSNADHWGNGQGGLCRTRDTGYGLLAPFGVCSFPDCLMNHPALRRFRRSQRLSDPNPYEFPPTFGAERSSRILARFCDVDCDITSLISSYRLDYAGDASGNQQVPRRFMDTGSNTTLAACYCYCVLNYDARGRLPEVCKQAPPRIRESGRNR
jgi:hypothetical protein